MVRTLYRIYLYLFSLVMLGFAAFTLNALLDTLLRLTALRGEGTAPTSSEVVQNAVLAVIGLVVSVALGGLHYWLIRRDIAEDQAAARGAVRSLFLNLAQGIAALVALFAGAVALQQIGLPYSADLSGPIAATVVATAVFVLLQVERGRSIPAAGAPMTLQRLHLYGVQIIVLLSSIGYWTAAISTAVRAILYGLNLAANPCLVGAPKFAPPGCDPTAQLVGEWLAALWAAGVWGVYLWLARGDSQSILRKVAQFLGFIVGLISAVVGVERAVELGLRAAFGLEASVPNAIATNYEFFAPLLFGLAVMAMYGVWLMSEAPATQLGQKGTELTTMALAAIVLGVPFYVAIIQLLHGLGEQAIAGTAFPHEQLAASLALLVSGLAHPFIAFQLRQETTEDAPIGARRGYVLAGLAAGALAGAIGGAIALYLLVTSLLGSPVSGNWPVTARTGAAVLLVGGYLAGIHLWRVMGERKLLTRAHPTVPVSASGVETVEAILDELLAGRITRAQAAERIRALPR